MNRNTKLFDRFRNGPMFTIWWAEFCRQAGFDSPLPIEVKGKP